MSEGNINIIVVQRTKQDNEANKLNNLDAFMDNFSGEKMWENHNFLGIWSSKTTDMKSHFNHHGLINSVTSQERTTFHYYFGDHVIILWSHGC